jgi:hypothetical protein
MGVSPPAPAPEAGATSGEWIQMRPLQPRMTATPWEGSDTQWCFWRGTRLVGTLTSWPRHRRPYRKLRVCSATPPSEKRDCTSAWEQGLRMERRA